MKFDVTMYQSIFSHCSVMEQLIFQGLCTRSVQETHYALAAVEIILFEDRKNVPCWGFCINTMYNQKFKKN